MNISQILFQYVLQGTYHFPQRTIADLLQPLNIPITFHDYCDMPMSATATDWIPLGVIRKPCL